MDQAGTPVRGTHWPRPPHGITRRRGRGAAGPRTDGSTAAGHTPPRQTPPDAAGHPTAADRYTACAGPRSDAVWSSRACPRGRWSSTTAALSYTASARSSRESHCGGLHRSAPPPRERGADSGRAAVAVGSSSQLEDTRIPLGLAGSRPENVGDAPVPGRPSPGRGTARVSRNTGSAKATFFCLTRLRTWAGVVLCLEPAGPPRRQHRHRPAAGRERRPSRDSPSAAGRRQHRRPTAAGCRNRSTLPPAGPHPHTHRAPRLCRPGGFPLDTSRRMCRPLSAMNRPRTAHRAGPIGAGHRSKAASRGAEPHGAGVVLRGSEPASVNGPEAGRCHRHVPPTGKSGSLSVSSPRRGSRCP